MHSKLLYRDVATLMATLTTDILLEYVRPWFDQRGSVPQLTVYAGKGRKTCHKRSRSGGPSTIQYGIDGVESHYNPSEAPLWTTSREIKHFGFFNGELTIPNCLTHIMCHEFSHYIQVVLGGRCEGSVHNEHFYRVLKKLLANPVTADLHSALMFEMQRRGMPMVFADGSTVVNAKCRPLKVCKTAGDTPVRTRLAKAS